MAVWMVHETFVSGSPLTRGRCEQSVSIRSRLDALPMESHSGPLYQLDRKSQEEIEVVETNSNIRPDMLCLAVPLPFFPLPVLDQPNHGDT